MSVTAKDGGETEVIMMAAADYKIRHRGKYYLWDSAKEKVIAFGLLDIESEKQGPLKEEELRQIFSQIVFSVLNASPFSRVQ